MINGQSDGIPDNLVDPLEGMDPDAKSEKQQCASPSRCPWSWSQDGSIVVFFKGGHI